MKYFKYKENYIILYEIDKNILLFRGNKNRWKYKIKTKQNDNKSVLYITITIVLSYYYIKKLENIKTF